MIRQALLWRRFSYAGASVLSVYLCWKIATKLGSYSHNILKTPVHFLDHFSGGCNVANLSHTHWINAKKEMSEEALINRTMDCLPFMNSLSQRFEDNPHPIGFAIAMHQYPTILELFLASSFHPQDSYCFHLDPKAPQRVQAAFHSLIGCYQQSFPETTLILIPHPVPVFWGDVSVLEADLKCMRALTRANLKWKEYINMAATELPVHNMSQIRSTLRSSSQSIVDSFPVPYNNLPRFARGMGLIRNGPNEYDYQFNDLGYQKTPPPLNITLRKGSRSVALKRDFVDFVLNTKTSWTLFNWMKSTRHPDEHFFSTLITLFRNRDKGLIPDIVTDHTHGFCVRLSWWYDTQCQGSNVRSICNFGMGDLERLRSEPRCMLANKFNLDVDSLAPICHSLANAYHVKTSQVA